MLPRRYNCRVKRGESVGPTLTEISREISPNKVFLVDGHSHNWTVEIAKDWVRTFYFKKAKVKAML